MAFTFYRDFAFGTLGDDRYSSGESTGSKYIFAGFGNDTVEDYSNVAQLISSGPGDDSVEAGDGNDTLKDLLGNDTLSGQDGNDVIIDICGNDSLYGGDGDDKITDFFGADKLYGEEGNDYLDAGFGSDLVSGGDDDDTILGGFGNDTLYGNDDQGDSDIVYEGATLIQFELGDTITTGFGRDVIRFDGDDDDHDLVTDFTIGQDRLEISEVDTVTQILITSGVHGPGLLITTGEGDNGLFLQGVTQELVIGTDIILDEVQPA